ncbi:TIM-barrel domain-containing protein [Parabacteroides bouchesdurhonensis]|uniref:glycoside hydrolase family 31 protein n=1 Tax=Parabacteroides bouchesdurhonensis TaxID=1936995 RepID=UPI000E4A01D0|nr:TIM-barrel domain-containing protein [Parabacteroides bouchesdurhonensis]RHJ92108.1 glycoside hydrolase family 31 protein [Bacteroides sp. AM07-16]
MRIVNLLLLFLFVSCSLLSASVTKKEIAPGVYVLSLGEKEQFTPFELFAAPFDNEKMAQIDCKKLPFALEDIILNKNERGCSIAIPLSDNEQLYGFGLQIGSFKQRGLKKRPLVNDYPLNNLGYTHAPQPFYVSTGGYGILINTPRYTTFHCGSNQLKAKQNAADIKQKEGTTNVEELYKSEERGNYVFVDIPNAEGIEVFVIEGAGIKEVIQRYNLLSGGGCLPPMWGLGLKYRVERDFNEKQVNDMADYFRKNQIPCDVFGLEPGWQTAAYSCSYIWNKDRFPEPAKMMSTLKEKGLRINLWEHAYVHPTSPIHTDIYDYSGDFLVWNGLVPDFTLPEARKVFGDYHSRLIEQGVSGFKLDECDNSNIGSGEATWGFPDMSVFPSGLDGERMHQLFGSLYLKTMDKLYKEKNQRAYQDYRSSGLFMSSVPASLYSDIYGHKDYIQMICNSSFGGLLWSPELRESASKEELFHRLQTVLLSAQALVNAWYLQNPPWLQYDKEKNNKGEFLADAREMEQITKTLVDMRMALIPYLYSAFNRYRQEGIPPFRPLVMDFQNDKKVEDIDDQYMIGDCLMAAPLYTEGNARQVYFPAGTTWYNFYTNEVYEGGREYTIENKLSELPLYVKSGSILPLAEPVQYITPETVFHITCNVYGKNPAPFTLFEDDGETYNYQNGEFNRLILKVEKNGKGKADRKGNFKGKRFSIDKWTFLSTD